MSTQHLHAAGVQQAASGPVQVGDATVAARIAGQQQDPQAAAEAMCRNAGYDAEDPGHAALCNYMKGELTQLPPLSSISRDVADNTIFLVPSDFTKEYGLSDETAAARLRAFQNHVAPKADPGAVSSVKIENYLMSGDLERDPLPALGQIPEALAKRMWASTPARVKADFKLTDAQAADRLRVVQDYISLRFNFVSIQEAESWAS